MIDDFTRQVAFAQEQIRDALRAGQRQSAFTQGVQPLAPQQPPHPQIDPMQLLMAQQMTAPVPTAPMVQPAPAQFAKGGLAVKPFWDKPSPAKKSKPLGTKQKAAAKRRAKAAGRPYPNLVDNTFAARRKK